MTAKKRAPKAAPKKKAEVSLWPGRALEVDASEYATLEALGLLAKPADETEPDGTVKTEGSAD